MKKWLILAFMFNFASSQIGFGFDFMSKHKMTNIIMDDVDYGSDNTDVNMGISINYISTPKFNNTSSVDLGFGVEYQIPRNPDDFDGQFWFQSVYLALFSKIDKKLYSIGEIGLATFEGDSDYEGDGIVSLVGGLYTGLGFGMIIDEEFHLHAIYKTNNGSFSQLLFSGLNSLDIDYDLKYTRLSVSLIYLY